MIETRLPRTAAVVLLPPSRQGNQHRILQPRLRPHPAGDFVAVHPRQADVEQNHRRMPGADRGERGRAVAGDLDFVPADFQERAEALGCVPVVIHNQDTARGRRGGVQAVLPPSFLRAGTDLRSERQADGEPLPCPGPSLSA